MRQTSWPCATFSRPSTPAAATTTLIDRLARSGHVRRKPHPRDRRALVLEASAASGAEVRRTMGTMHTRMVEVARSLPPEDAAIVVDFLTRMREAVDQID